MSDGHVYVHVPFCVRRCTYCDFSIAVRRRVPVEEYLGALAAERDRSAPPAPPATLYLGGGTPSLVGGGGVARIASLLGVREAPDEFTVEANPDDVTAEAARAWVGAGVTRLSIGAQSFDDRVLAWMHRTHDAAAIPRAVAVARAAGIRDLSLDLIFALPESLGRDFAADLAATIALDPDHISLYGLTVEPGTALARQMDRGASAAAPDQRYEEDYLEAHAALEAAGYPFYEVSNAARPGKEAVHNRAYWRLAPYRGLGPSAHSFDGVSRWWNEPAYARWRERLARHESPVAGREILSEPQRRLEQRYLGLRTREGIAVTPELRAAVGQWERAGWAAVTGLDAPDGPRVRLTPRGWLRLDALVASI